jgi:stage V sporulation protein D (sporulation-specific penicillin-binding protein)
MVGVFVIVLVLFVALTFRIGWIQIVAAEQYASKAAEYQIKDTRTMPGRGAIFDRNMNELAVSTISYRVWVRLKPVDSNDEEFGAKLAEQKDLAAAALAPALGKSIAELLAELDVDQTLVRVASDMSKAQMEQIREQINEKDINIIEFEQRTTRKYPLGTLASKVIGSVNYDGVGQAGVEMEYNQYLSGVAGRKIVRTDGVGGAITGGERADYASTDGYSVVLTIDEAMQYYAEEALKKGLERTEADRMMAIVLDPKTGEVLAMADTDPYDPNDPGRPITQEERAIFGVMPPEEQTAYLSKMWRNPVISDVYDPGSPFKTITVSSGLEDGVITPETTFNCAGSFVVADRNIRCWVYPGAHGMQTVRDGTANSCNPVMMQITQALTYPRFYNYLQLFGITEKTGIDLPGEENPLVQDADTAGPVGLATMSFGQGLSVTPVQMATAIGAIANDGKLMKPHVVKAYADSEGNIVEEIPNKIERMVISENTSREVREIMEHVSEVQAKNSPAAKISGYRIGIKTGTTQKLVNGEYSESAAIGSMVIVAPIDDPKFVALVLCDTPRVGYYGIGTAGPVVNEIATELLQYLNVKPNYTEEEIAKMNSEKIPVADYTDWTLADADASLALLGLRSNLTSPEPADEDGPVEDGLEEGKQTTAPAQKLPSVNMNLKVKDQYPKPGTLAAPGSTVFLYWE